MEENTDSGYSLFDSASQGEESPKDSLDEDHNNNCCLAFH